MTTEPISEERTVDIEQEMRSSYLDYAMSVIVSRALPAVRDGLKPVQRRIIWGMWEGGARAGAAYRKSAGIVGDVMGRYPPHGDAPVYEALVHLAQPFSMRYPLVDGQGNFGSIDGDAPAAQRYTEARLAPIAEELLADIDQNTVDFQDNYDGRFREPVVLPARIPNLLLNGADGIAVGMATKIPPHNLGEICDAIALLIENPEATLDDLLQVVRGPDFPTAGIALVGKDREQIRLAYGEGHGRITMHARTHIEEAERGRVQIVVTELPFQVKKAQLIEKIADLVRDRKIDGIADIRDESDREGMRIVIELKREGSAEQVKNLLFKHTAMRSTFAVNMMVIVDGTPRRIGLKRALELFIDHRREVIRRRSEFQLEQARRREHILAGLLKAIEMVDLVIATIRGADSAAHARELLQGKAPLPERVLELARARRVQVRVANPFSFSEEQANAILDMQLRRLASLERQALEKEYQEVIEQIAYLEDLLANPRKIDFLIKEDVLDLKKKYGDERRTEIVEADPEEFREEDLVPDEPCVITLSRNGYIKRMPLDTFRRQRRGGVGVRGAAVREEDAVIRLAACRTHDDILFFTDRGKVYHLRAYDIPDQRRESGGRHIANLIELDGDENVTTIVPVRDFSRDYMVLATRNGLVKKTPLREFAEVRRNGKLAMRLEGRDESGRGAASADSLIAARVATNDTHVIMVSSDGFAIRFKIDDLREASRMSGGVRGIRLQNGERVVGVETVDDGEDLLVVTEKGYGKRTRVSEYPLQGRGGKGVKTLRITPRTGKIAAARLVRPEQEILVVSADGVVIRTPVRDVSRQGRDTQGVRIMQVGENDRVAAVAVVTVDDANGAGAAAQGAGRQRGRKNGRG